MGDLMEWLTRCRTDQEDIYIISSGRELYTSINYIFSKVANKKDAYCPEDKLEMRRSETRRRISEAFSNVLHNTLPGHEGDWRDDRKGFCSVLVPNLESLSLQCWVSKQVDHISK